jgi:hypothetical protein
VVGDARILGWRRCNGGREIMIGPGKCGKKEKDKMKPRALNIMIEKLFRGEL